MFLTRYFIDEIAGEKQKTFPDAVLESFNELLTQKFNGTPVIIKQDDVLALMIRKGLNREEIFEKGWLDVEGAYRAAGWKVSYDKPGFNETYDANFTFKR